MHPCCRRLPSCHHPYPYPDKAQNRPNISDSKRPPPIFLRRQYTRPLPTLLIRLRHLKTSHGPTKSLAYVIHTAIRSHRLGSVSTLRVCCAIVSMEKFNIPRREIAVVLMARGVLRVQYEGVIFHRTVLFVRALACSVRKTHVLLPGPTSSRLLRRRSSSSILVFEAKIWDSRTHIPAAGSSAPRIDVLLKATLLLLKSRFGVLQVKSSS